MTEADREQFRISDDERQATISRLRAENAVGRLNLDEFEERCEEAARARTRSDLALVLRELPPPAPARIVTAGTVATSVAVNGACIAWWGVAGAETAFWPGWVIAGTSAVIAMSALRDWVRLRAH